MSDELSVRPKDLSYEALAEVTGTDMNEGRGQLNAALKSIREQTEFEEEYLPDEIRTRAKMYRQLMPEVMLTPTALSKHWKRVAEETRKVRGVNLDAAPASRYPPSRREQNLEEARKLMSTLWGGSP